MLPIWKSQTFSRKESSLLWTEHRVSTRCACLSVELKLQQWVAISLLRSRVSLAEIEHALYRARGVLLFNRGRCSGLLCLFTLSWTSYGGSLSPQFRRDTVLPERLLQLSATDTESCLRKACWELGTWFTKAINMHRAGSSHWYLAASQNLFIYCCWKCDYCRNSYVK